MQIQVSASSDAEVSVSPVYNTPTLYGHNINSTPYPWHPCQSFSVLPCCFHPHILQCKHQHMSHLLQLQVTVIQQVMECTHYEFILYQGTLVYVMAAKESTDLLELLMTFVSNMKNGVRLLHRDRQGNKVSLETYITTAVFHACVLSGHHSFLTQL